MKAEGKQQGQGQGGGPVAGEAVAFMQKADGSSSTSIERTSAFQL
jgi:hypothetical protein